MKRTLTVIALPLVAALLLAAASPGNSVIGAGEGRPSGGAPEASMSAEMLRPPAARTVRSPPLPPPSRSVPSSPCMKSLPPSETVPLFVRMKNKPASAPAAVARMSI